MATFYIQLENRLLQISGDLTAENVSKALGYVPVSSNVTNELSQRVDNITFDSLKDNPFLQDGSGELNIVDEAGNIIAKIDAEGLHSVDFIAGEHRLSNKTDKTYVDEAIKNVEVDLTGYATEEYVNNIDFYNIKDNPIVNNGDGKLLFVDENGYIGLQLEEDGLYVKDVIADGHTLSQKANKSDIPSLDGYATESYVNTNLQNYATKDEVSDLVDMSVVTELQGKVNTLVGEDSDKSVRTIANEELAALLLAGNDNLQSLLELAAWIDEHPEDASAMNEAIQTNTSNITKLDTAYKEADVKVLTDANEYTDNINFYTIKDNPIVNGEAGSLTFVDETGYIGLKVTEDGIIVKDVVTSEHKLSDKANTSDIPTKVSQLQNDANYILDDVVSDGVYAVDANGKLIDYNTADSSCLGVALIAGEHKFMIAKSDATNDGSNYNLYWEESCTDLSLTNYSNADGTNSYGYLGGTSTPELNKDFTTWTAGALSDFNGKANTAVIAAASSDAKDMCTVLKTFNASDSFKDWYVPACGQLALMYLNMTEINAALAKIGGTALAAGSYWSSSEGSSNYAWHVYFDDGYVYNGYKGNSGRVRFVRDISISKSLKERVSELESGKQDKLVSGTNIKTINGESILGSGDITIEGGSIASDSNIYVWKNPDWLINGQNQGTITEEVYNAIYNADIVYCVTDEFSSQFPYDEGGSLKSSSICLTKLDFSFAGSTIYLRTLYKDGDDENTLNTIDISISKPYDDYLYNVSYSRLKIPTKTSDLVNDSGFISDDILSDGTYAVRLDGSLCSIDEADNSCIALAVISGEQKFWIEKSGPSGSIAQTYGTTFIWGSSEDDISGIPNISDNTEDFNGKSNTEASINQTTTLTEDTTIFEYCKKFNNSDENLGYSDWYIPSKDQLALILNSSYGYYSFSGVMININGGWVNTDFFDDKYWSSSEKSTTQAWMYCRDDFSGLGIVNKSTKGYCILIRDFEVKTIKERISILEEKINKLPSTNVSYATTGYVDSVLGDINSILESIINGSNKTIITFYVDNDTFQAEEGMTWEEFINSKYNISGFFIKETSNRNMSPWKTDSLVIVDPNPTSTKPGSNEVSFEDLIIANYEYNTEYNIGKPN